MQHGTLDTLPASPGANADRSHTAASGTGFTAVFDLVSSRRTGANEPTRDTATSGGVFDTSYKAHVAHLADTKSRPWRWKASESGEPCVRRLLVTANTVPADATTAMIDP